MALTQNDLEALDRAIASSELEVEMDGRRVKYRTTSELIAARDHVASIVRPAAPRRSAFRFTFTTSRGD